MDSRKNTESVKTPKAEGFEMRQQATAVQGWGTQAGFFSKKPTPKGQK
ncbi:hypothetical protein [Helicobacter zhangjianzhongii]|uniref:Uncharacterized protein n=1 Tax=Helicobacter zhangjianzhongii TaxID=2974574 RepID=A0ACC6FTH9_9HELI|nr:MULTISPECIES: hypothetical protein [unclassified Helicobacter]MDL0080621.1 hypothetical protein [Helicobacter sp. CPD2-1]MDL0082560.1 hypothetical protein [Helicobacter sp. XJK30-2]